MALAVLAVLAGVAVVLLASCGPRERMPAGDDGMATTDGRAAPAADTVYSVDLRAAGMEPDSVAGRVAVVAAGGGDPLNLEIEGRGLPPGEHAWHVHQGACGSSGEIVIALTATGSQAGLAGPLMVDSTGHFDADVAVPALTRTMVGSEQHSLHVHEAGGTAPGPTIACATI
ncbi:MAG: hypothetical protein R2882_12430 [Gemmatimonadales bacterium]